MVDDEFAWFRAGSPGDGAIVRRDRPIGRRAAVAGDLPGDTEWCRPRSRAINRWDLPNASSREMVSRSVTTSGDNDMEAIDLT